METRHDRAKPAKVKVLLLRSKSPKGVEKQKRPLHWVEAHKEGELSTGLSISPLISDSWGGSVLFPYKENSE